MDLDHAYTLSMSKDSVMLPSSSVKLEVEDDLESDLEECEDDDPYEDLDASMEDQNLDDSTDGREDESMGGRAFKQEMADSGSDTPSGMIWKVLLPTEEWMQMLPPHYLLHYIRERTVSREPGKNTSELRDPSTPLKRGWLQGAWRETLKEVIARQTDIPCVIYFNSSNFLKQPYSRKVGAPLWRVRACCRQDDGKCLRFNVKVLDFHPSEPNVEIILSAVGTLMTGPEAELRHTYTASDHVKVLKSLQRFNQQGVSKENRATGDPNFTEAGALNDFDNDKPVARYQLTVPTDAWISYMPAEAAEAYVLERSHVSKDRLGPIAQTAWSRSVLVPRVTKECRMFLKEALAVKTGLPCRICLTGRCHLKPPFSRKKRAPLFVTSGFCGRNDNKCLRFKFIVQDFDPSEPEVRVDVEVRGVLLTGKEGEERHKVRTLKRAGRASLDEASQVDVARKRPRLPKKSDAQPDAQPDSQPDSLQDALQDPQQELQQDPQQETQPDPWGETVLDAHLQAVNTIEVVSEGNPDMGEEDARELVRLANEALNAADGSGGSSRLTATKIVQSGDQVFIFVNNPDEEPSIQQPLESVEVIDPVAAGLEMPAVPQQEEEEDEYEEEETLLLSESALGNASQEPSMAVEEPHTDEADAESPLMEYRWQMRVSMVDWLRVLPAKSLRFYLHERTVSREVWVEEGWEKQFHGQTLQAGWRDVIRRAVVEQTDVPCQFCFRGRSCLKLPFSRKHSAALWRTQAYCSKGEKRCLLYKMWVQDFHPDDEDVLVEISGVGRMHRDCAKWFTGVGTPVSEEAIKEKRARVIDPGRALKEEAVAWEALFDDGDGGHQDAEPGGNPAAAEEPAEEPAEETADEPVEGVVPEQLYQAVIEILDSLKESLAEVKQCPVKMQAMLKAVQSADALLREQCQSESCLCEQITEGDALGSLEPFEQTNNGDWFEEDNFEEDVPSASPAPLATTVKSTPKTRSAAGASEAPKGASKDPTKAAPKGRPSRKAAAKALSASQPRGLRPILPAPPPLPPATAVASPAVAAPSAASPTAPPAASPATSPGAHSEGSIQLRPMAVVRTVSGAFSAVPLPGSPRPVLRKTQPTIIHLTPSQQEAARAAVTAPATHPAHLSKLSSAIERSAMHMSALSSQRASSSPRPATPARQIAAVKRTLASTPTATATATATSTVVTIPTPAPAQPLASSTPAVRLVAQREAGDADEAVESWILEQVEEVEGEEPTPTEAVPKVKQQPARRGRRPSIPSALNAASTQVSSPAKLVFKPVMRPFNKPVIRVEPPVTRNSKIIVGLSSKNPPPLAPISKVSPVKVQPAPIATTVQGSQVTVLSSKATSNQTPSQPSAVSSSSSQTRLLASVLSDKQPVIDKSKMKPILLPKGGKYLILKTATPQPQLRSSTQKS